MDAAKSPWAALAAASVLTLLAPLAPIARPGGAPNKTYRNPEFKCSVKVYDDWNQVPIEAGDKYVDLAKNSLDEMSLASPALAPGTLFIRTQTRLYRIGR